MKYSGAECALLWWENVLLFLSDSAHDPFKGADRPRTEGR